MTMFEDILEGCTRKQGTYTVRERQQSGSSGNVEGKGEADLSVNELFDMFTTEVRQTIFESLIDTVINGDCENSTGMINTCREARVETYEEWSRAYNRHYKKINKAIVHNVEARYFLWRLFARRVIPDFARYAFDNTITTNKRKFFELEKSLRKLQAIEGHLKAAKPEPEPVDASLLVHVDWASMTPSEEPICNNNWPCEEVLQASL